MQRVREQIKCSRVWSFAQLNYSLPSSQAGLRTKSQMSNSQKVFIFTGDVSGNYSAFLRCRTTLCPASCALHHCHFIPMLIFLPDLEPQKPVGVEEKLRRPFFSASLGLPSPRSNPTRRRPIKHDSWVGHIAASVRHWCY